MRRFYPIGTPGSPWTEDDKATWLARQSPERSYREEVIDKSGEEIAGGVDERGE